MITGNLFKNILVNPTKDGCDTLFIVAGYASAKMARKHLEFIEKLQLSRNVSVKLIVGMCPVDGIARHVHEGLQQLCINEYPQRFECYYTMKSPSVHTKLYVWVKDKKPVVAFSGSANYTQTAFFDRQLEAMSSCSPVMGMEYFRLRKKDTIDCRDPKVSKFISIQDRLEIIRRMISEPPTQRESGYDDLEHLKISLLGRNGDVQKISGLNWGQRPGRNHSEAYIPIPSSVRAQNFFPDHAVEFTVLTEENIAIECVVAQQGSKAIHSHPSNSLWGVYFRKRLGLSDTDFVTKEHLERYGRTDVDFYKVDDETYRIYFSVDS